MGMRLTTRGKVVGGFAVALVVLLALGWGSYSTPRRLIALTAERRQTLRLLERLATLQSRLNDAESGERGYLLTGADEYLAPYLVARGEIGPLLEEIHQLCPSGDASARPLAELDALVPQELSELKRTVDFAQNRRNGGFVQALAIVRTGKGKKLMDQIRAAISDISTAQERRRDELLTATESASRTLQLTSLITPLALVFVGASGWMVLRDLSARNRAGRRLYAAQEFTRHLLDGVQDYAILTLDPQGRVTSWNAGAQRIKGYSADEMIGQHFSRFYPEEAVARGWPETELARAAAEGRFEDEGWRVRKDGSRFWANVIITPMRDADGAVTGYCKISRDLTDRKRAEDEVRHLNETLEDRVRQQTAKLTEAAEQRRKAEERFRLVVEAAPNGMVMIDAAGRIVLVNQQSEKLFGYCRDELLGQAIELLVPERYRDKHPGYRSAFFDNPDMRPMGMGRDLYGRRKDGGEFPVEIGLTPIDTAEGPLVLSLVVDITERKRAEEEIRKLNANLEERVVERTAQLEAANKELEAFSYSISHDLRAPLRAIDGFSRIVMEDYAPALPEEAKGYLSDVRANTLRMGNLVDDLLAFSRLSRLPVKKETVPVSGVVEHCLRELTSAGNGRSIEVRVGDLPACQADPSLLKQVWTNLLSNAFKYTGKREAALIEIGAQPGGGSSGAVYFVKDNGVGFDMRYASKLFGVFQRLHRIEDYDGTGVGLAIVQRIIHRHGGRIWADAAPDKGATFFFTLEEGSHS